MGNDYESAERHLTSLEQAGPWGRLTARTYVGNGGKTARQLSRKAAFDSLIVDVLQKIVYVRVSLIEDFKQRNADLCS